MYRSNAELQFQVHNLGSVREGTFAHKPLTVFCGPNNGGKTWTLYSLYHFYQTVMLIKRSTYSGSADRLGFDDLDDLNDYVSSTLPHFFNVSTDQLKAAEFHIDSAVPIDQLISGIDETGIFLMPAERNGLHLFYRELRTRRTALLHHASREGIDVEQLLRDVMRSRYAEPIADYIDWLNELTEIQETKSTDFHFSAEHIKRALVGGAYRVDARTGSIEFRPYRARGDKRLPRPMRLHTTSSAVKSLFALWFYLEHQAEVGDVVMIDEPELNLHPDNQIKVARLLARLVNQGINIVISTHSDYIIREFNVMTMLHERSSAALRKRFGYRDEDVLDPTNVGAYLFEGQGITEMQVTQELGIHATTFDDVIEAANDRQQYIYYRLHDEVRGG